MTTIEISNAEIERRFEECEREQDAAKPAPEALSKAAKAAYTRAKAASRAQDKVSTAQVDECRRHREGVVSARVPAAPGKQSNLFDF